MSKQNNILNQCQEPKCTKCGSEFEEEIWKTPSTDYEEYICSNEKCCAVHTVNIERHQFQAELDIERDWSSLEFSYIWEQGLKKDNDEPEDFEGHCPECDDDDLEQIDGDMDYQELKCAKGHNFVIECKGWIIS